MSESNIFKDLHNQQLKEIAAENAADIAEIRETWVLEKRKKKDWEQLRIQANSEIVRLTKEFHETEDIDELHDKRIELNQAKIKAKILVIDWQISELFSDRGMNHLEKMVKIRNLKKEKLRYR